ncbi:universal stress protein [Halomonas daqiaonensis]|uniref:Nucleotide-binding universal stress protein, UspA family n=1 Tax=Halomonas daqiaonensis TaxID=650850 RepID=A0A1H7VDW7_9GAMM|nr:universal stress protein [Halomonas daqiaonensis]SEM07079.1 Nucleotide-binding universal stress protein, UspA family [Halomonas daqiaonensis]
MFQKIMVPVDLAHLDVIEPALEKVADLARHYDAEVCYVGVTSNAPSSVARTPQEYAQKLEAFAKERAEVHGQPVSTKTINSPDVIADLDDILIKAIDEVGADLVVMPTHPPKHLDVIIPSHGGKVASHTKASVFLVRPFDNKSK